MRKQVAPDHLSCGNSGFCSKVLGGQRESKADDSKKNHKAAHFPEISGVFACYADVDHSCDYQRNKKLEGRFQHFKQGSQQSDDWMVF